MKGQTTRAAAAEPELAQYQHAVRLNPGDANAHAALCDALRALGQFDAAVASARRAVALGPDQPDFHNSLGAALHGLGDIDAAVASFRRALALAPGHAAANLNLADTLHNLGQFDEAVAHYRRSLGALPDQFAANVNLAAALSRIGQYQAAHDSFRRALDIRPDDPAVRRNLGAMLRHLGLHQEALAQHQQLLAASPGNAQCHYDLGICHHGLGNAELAVASLRQALELDPGHAAAHSYLGFVLMEQGEREMGLHHYRRALELCPASAAEYSNVLFALSHCTTDAEELTAAHFGFGERFEAPLRAHWPLHANQRDPDRVLQVGFVSADLHSHSVATFIEPIFEALAQSRHLSLHVYYNNFVEDEVTQRLRGYVAHWHSIATLSDEAAAQQIQSDRIDILIDLSGHTALNRLHLFARKPAPIQASWIGYAGTTGLQAMDYYIADGFYLPEGKYDEQFTEQIVRLPLGAAFLPAPVAPPVNPLPALTNGYLTFASFNRANKLSREVIALWAGLLRTVPDARLLLGGLHPGADTTVLGWFADEGIDLARLTLQPRGSLYEYLEQHHKVDICLTPFPYAGGTTMCHALWMGVPVLTTVGATNPSHTSVCYLAHLGLASFVAEDDDTYFKLGAFLSENLGELAELRAGMRERFNASVAGYPAIAAAGVEHALRLMWLRWCDGLPPEPIRVRLSDLMSNAEPDLPDEDHPQPA